MNFFQLVIKQMRQRALSTWLTLLSVFLGVGLAVAIMILRRESAALFGQSDFGYDLIIGPPKGAPLQLTLNTVYHLDVSPGVIPYELYEEMGPRAPASGQRSYFREVKLAIPFMVGDSFNGRRIVGTSPRMFNADDEGKPLTGEFAAFEYRLDKRYELAAGRPFHARKFEAVIGADTAEHEHFAIYDPSLTEEQNEKRHAVFQATHGFPGPNEKPDIHRPRWHVVGILKPTHTANDRVLFVPVVSLYAIEEHEVGMLMQALMRAGIDPTKLPPPQLTAELAKLGYTMDKVPEELKKRWGLAGPATHPAAPPGELMRDPGELLKDPKPAAPAPAATAEAGGEDEDAYHLNPDGTIVPDLPKANWELSAILVKSRSSFAAQTLIYGFKVVDNRATAVSPASVMRDFFDTFLKGSTIVLLIISLLVTIVAGVGILVSIYNSVSARIREIAILRALGATRTRILAMICVEAGLIGLAGAILGFVGGHLCGAVESYFFNRQMGQEIDWMRVGWHEPWYLNELVYLALVPLLAMLAGIVPALKAYRAPVATNLSAG